MRFSVLSSLLACTACQPTSHDLTLRERNQAELYRIADKCGLPRKTFRLLGDSQVLMQPASDADYERVDCALGEIKDDKAAAGMKFGFIGNEYYTNEVQR